LPQAPEPAPPTELTPDHLDHVVRPDAPAFDRVTVRADSQTSDNGVYHLRGHAVIELSDSIMKADEIDYNEETGDVEARGHVYYQNFLQNEKITASKVEYNVDTLHGKYYDVSGYVKSQVNARPGLLTSSNPFYFQGKWAERIEDKYIVHDGLITGCVLPRPWWTLHGPKFNVIPGKRALAYRPWFFIKRFPVFYMPFFYKSLDKEPRHSGFLTPNIGHSSLRGYMLGLGYYWAIARSYDLTYRFQDWTQVGYAQTLDFRGKPFAGTDFGGVIYGVDQTRGYSATPNQTYSGFDATVSVKSDLGDGWIGRADINYLSSLGFRQQFTESFSEAIFSESVSTGFITKHFGPYAFDVLAQHLQLFQDATPGDYVILRKLPQVDFSSRDQQVSSAVLPVWFSFASSAGLLHRSNPTEVTSDEYAYSSSGFMPRVDVAPRVMTDLSWDGFSITPYFEFHETYFGQSFANGALSGGGIGSNPIANIAINRIGKEFGFDLTMPSLERIYDHKTFLGDKLKHVIEPRVTYKYLTGVNDFNRLIRFDETELLNDTNQVEYSVTNRLYAKRGDTVTEVLTWEVAQERYFDPTFGGAIVPGQRNVILDSLEFTGYAFLDQPRNYSPIDSLLRLTPKNGFSVEWRADYDPLRGGLIDSGFRFDVRVKHWAFNGGNNDVRGVTLYAPAGQTQSENQTYISPPANQFVFYVGYGDTNRRGWNAAVTGIYDYRASQLDFATVQLTYNTDCCGFSGQLREFNFGSGISERHDTQYRLAFTIANVGQFGNLRKNERLF
jgi:LPS-assembly protein